MWHNEFMKKGKQFKKNVALNIFLVVVIVVCVAVMALMVINRRMMDQELREAQWRREYKYACRVDEWGKLVDVRECAMYQHVEKPVIYLYTEDEQEVEVKLDFDGEVFASWPEYRDGGWKVRAFPDGRLVQGGREFSYLFWEGRPNEQRKYDWSTGFVVKGSEIREFLREKLTEIGLTPKEYNEFIVYWYPKMQENEWNLVHFASFDEYDRHAKLDISPVPDAVLRVFMVYKAVDGSVKVAPQTFSGFERKGFTVVEWGGAEAR